MPGAVPDAPSHGRILPPETIRSLRGPGNAVGLDIGVPGGLLGVFMRHALRAFLVA